MAEKLFTREIIADFVETRLRHLLSMLRFHADPLNLAQWEKFISCLRGETKQEAQS